MDVKICGPGCTKCNEAYDLAAKGIGKCDKDIQLEKITDFQKIAMMGIFSTPAVVVNNEIMCVGRVPTEKEFLDWLG